MAQTPFVINPALVAIANDYAGINMQTRGYIQDRVVPRITVDAPLFRYPEYPVEEAFTVYDDQVGRVDRLNEILESATEATGSVIDHGLLEKIPYRDMMAATNQSIPFNLKARAVRNVLDKVQLNREIRCSTILTSPANYQTGYKIDKAVSGPQWSDLANSDPVQEVNDAAASMLIPPNVAVMSLEVRNILRRHPKVSVALGGSQNSGRYVTDQEIAQALGVERIEIANTLRATSKRGQALTTGKVWGKFLALLYLPPLNADGTAIDAGSPGFALTFQWGGKVSGENAYRPGEMGLYGGVGVLTGESLVEKLVAPFAGYLFSNAVA